MSKLLTPQQIALVWRPLQGSQALAMGCRCNHILYHGTRGPGKTDAQLMYFRQFVGQGYGAFWRGVIFDRSYKSLDDLIAKSKKWFKKFGDGAKFHESKSDYKWTWPTGEELLFRHIRKKDDYLEYHGQEFTFIGWNELTKHPTAHLYNEMMSCNRSSFRPHLHSPKDPKTGEILKLLPDIPLVVFSTTNPSGPGHNWVKRKFIDKARPGVIVRTTTNVFNPRTKQREDVVKTQVHIFGSYKENTYLDPIYIAELENITDPNKRRAWLWGDWNITSGGAFDDLWTNAIIKPRFAVPSNWYLDRTFDWGSSDPFSVGWWAEANGEEVILPDGSTFAPAAGSIILFAEWYGCALDKDGEMDIGANKGIKLSAKNIAIGIREREEKLRENGWYTGTINPGPADNSIGNIIDSDEESIQKKMLDLGVAWSPSDKSKGSRVNGFQLFRDRLEASNTGEGPAFYVMDNCYAEIATLPTLPRDEDNADDVDTDAEDHTWDKTRYRILACKNRTATKIDVAFAT